MPARYKHKKPFLHRSREFLGAPIHAVAHHRRIFGISSGAWSRLASWAF
jgi:hypothetical protein